MTDKAVTIFDQLIDRPIAFHPCLVKISGGLASGVLLSQLLYWSRAMRDKEFYKTGKELMDETGLTEMEMRGAKSRLKQKGFITTRLKRHPATTHYKIHRKAIIEAISSLVKSPELDRLNHPNKIGQITQTIHLSENTTENTTDTLSLKKSSGSKPKPSNTTNPEIRLAVDHYHAEFIRIHGIRPVINGAAAKTFQGLLGDGGRPLGEGKELTTAYLSLPDENLKAKGFPVEWLPGNINGLLLKKKPVERGFVH